MPVSSLLCLVQSRPLQCVWLNESVTFFIYLLWFLFYELSGSEWAFVFFLQEKMCPRRARCRVIMPQLQASKARRCRYSAQKRTLHCCSCFHTAFAVSFVEKAVVLCPGTCPAYDIYIAHYGESAQVVYYSVPCPWLFPSGNQRLHIHIFPCKQLQHMEQKALCCSQRNIHR